MTPADGGSLGDGINNATALHSADVGISVETAVDVTKDAADIVLLEKDLGVLVAGLREGRRAFANTLKYIFITTSANFGNMVSMAVASLFTGFLPLLPLLGCVLCGLCAIFRVKTKLPAFLTVALLAVAFVIAFLGYQETMVSGGGKTAVVHLWDWINFRWGKTDAQSVVGTNLSPMGPYWKKMVYGYRRFPLPN